MFCQAYKDTDEGKWHTRSHKTGQLIVCEKEGADWLPFTEFRKNKTSLNKNYNEVVYIK